MSSMSAGQINSLKSILNYLFPLPINNKYIKYFIEDFLKYNDLYKDLCIIIIRYNHKFDQNKYDNHSKNTDYLHYLKIDGQKLNEIITYNNEYISYHIHTTSLYSIFICNKYLSQDNILPSTSSIRRISFHHMIKTHANSNSDPMEIMYNHRTSNCYSITNNIDIPEDFNAFITHIILNDYNIYYDYSKFNLYDNDYNNNYKKMQIIKDAQQQSLLILDNARIEASKLYYDTIKKLKQDIIKLEAIKQKLEEDIILHNITMHQYMPIELSYSQIPPRKSKILSLIKTSHIDEQYKFQEQLLENLKEQYFKSSHNGTNIQAIPFIP